VTGSPRGWLLTKFNTPHANNPMMIVKPIDQATSQWGFMATLLPGNKRKVCQDSNKIGASSLPGH
jgi:hypothetical protein